MMHQTAPSILRKGVGVGEDPSGGIHDTSNSTIDLEAGWVGGGVYRVYGGGIHDT